MKMEPDELFKVFSVDTRVKIVELLKEEGQLGVKELAARLGLTASAISQHLKVLKNAGLVRSERHGYWIPYSINEEAMECCRGIVSEVCSCDCDDEGRERPRSDGGLEALRKYEASLSKEIEAVRRRIEELEAGD